MRKENSKANNNLDILIITDNSLETVGGEQESTKIIIEGIKNKYSVGLIQPGSLKTLIGVEFYKLTSQTRIKYLIKQPVAFVNYIRKVRNIICVKKPKIIHTQAQVSFFIIALLKKLKLISKDYYIIHTERGLYTKYSYLFKKIFHFFFKELDTLVTTTNYNMEHWKDAIKHKNIDYKIIENTAGEIFESYNPTFEKNDSGIISVGFAGRYTEWKNWPLAVEISKKLHDVLGKKLFIKMAVGCLDEDAIQETKKMFKDLKTHLGSQFEGVINISINDMDVFYYNIDVFILTSKENSESFGRTLVEAMSRKTAVLTTNAGGAVEVVNNNNNVMDSANEFVERVLLFAKHREVLNNEKKDNMDNTKNHYSLYNNTIKHEKMYNSILR